eukprot:1583134-Rhodomonas_salina.1
MRRRRCTRNGACGESSQEASFSDGERHKWERCRRKWHSVAATNGSRKKKEKGGVQGGRGRRPRGGVL